MFKKITITSVDLGAESPEWVVSAAESVVRDEVVTKMDSPRAQGVLKIKRPFARTVENSFPLTWRRL